MKRIVILLSILLLLLAACVGNEELQHRPTTPGGEIVEGEESEVIFSLRVPFLPTTRALTDDDENVVSEVDVLVFEHGNDGRYLYSSRGFLVPSEGGDANTYDFKVGLLQTKDTNKVDLWVLANAPRRLLDLVATEDTKSSLAAKLVVTESDNATQTATTGKATPIPMWGKILNCSITEEGLGNAGSSSSDVGLTRMVARINVSLKANIAEETFRLKTVYFYNRNANGRLVPLNEGDDPASPSLPALIEKPAAGNNPQSLATADDKTLKNTIYAFEAEAGDGYDGTKQPAYENETCLVIGGLYNGSTTETFYRVDFATQATSQSAPTYLPLLRNHSYEVVVQSVSARGFPTKEAALEARPVNILASVEEWDSGGMDEVVFDGQYMLSFNRDSIIFYRNAGTQTIEIYTTWEEGWTIDTSQDDFPNWLSVPQGQNSVTTIGTTVKGEVGKRITLCIDNEKLPTARNERTGSFYVSAGRLTKEIRVKQKESMELTVRIEPLELVFKRDPIAAKSVTVNIVPPSVVATVTAGTQVGGGSITWVTDKSPLGREITSGQTLQLLPQAKAENDQEDTAVPYIFTVTSGDQTVQQRLVVTQLANPYIWEFKPALAPFLADCDQAMVSREVLAETTWKLTTADASMLTLSPAVSGSYRPSTDGVYKPYDFFTLSDNHGYIARKATITVMSDNPNYRPYSFSVDQYGTDPALVLTSSDADERTILNLDDSGQRELSFTSNAHWMLATNKQADDVDYGRIVSSTSYGAIPLTNFPTNPYSNTDITSALTTENFNLAFTPAAGGTTDTEAAGSPLKTTLSLTTIDHSSAPAVNKTLSLTRAAVARWDGVDSWTPNGTSNLPNENATVTVTAKTNMAWWVGYQTGTDDADSPATSALPAAYTPNPSLVVEIPTHTQSLATRSVSVWANNTGSSDTNAHRQNFTQDAASLNIASWTGVSTNKIPAAGGTPLDYPLFNFSGTYDGPVTLYAYDASNNELGNHENPAGKTGLKTTVSANTSMSDRDITFGFQGIGLSAPIALAPTTYTLKQAGTAPSLTLPSPNPDGTTLNLELETGRTQTFQTNAHWTLETVTPASGYVPASRILSSAKDGETTMTNFPATASSYTNTANNNALNSLHYILNFTKNASGGSSDTEIADSLLQTQLRLKTTDHGDAPAVSKTLTLTRKAVARWDGTDSFSPASGQPLANENPTVTVAAKTNMEWWVSFQTGSDNAGSQTATVSAAPYTTPYPSKTITIPIHSKSMAPRTVTVWANKKNATETTDRATYSQAGASLTPNGMNGTDAIPAAGSDSYPTFNFTGTYDGPVTLYAYDALNNPLGDHQNTATAIKTNLTTSVSPNTGTSARTVKFSYKGDGMDAPLAFGTYTLQQNGTAPTLALTPTDALSTTLDLNAAATTSLAFVTNAHWTLESAPLSGDKDYDRLVSTTTDGGVNKTIPFTNNSNNNAMDTPTYTLAFTPNNGASDTEAAGTELKTTLTLKTADHSPIDPISRTITLKREAAERWGTPSFSPLPSAGNLPATGAQVVASVATNMSWWVGYKVGTETAVTGNATTAQPYGTSSQEINIPANTKSMTTRTVIAYAGKSDQTVTQANFASYTQDAPTLAISSWTPGSSDIARAGGTGLSSPTFTFSGSYNGKITMYTYDGATLLATYENSDNTKTSVKTSVPANNTWANRTITFGYAGKDQTTQKLTTGTYKKTQTGYNISLVGDNTFLTTGSTYTFEIKTTTSLPTSYVINAYTNTNQTGTNYAQNNTQSGAGTGKKITINNPSSLGGLTLYLYASSSYTTTSSPLLKSVNVPTPTLAEQGYAYRYEYVTTDYTYQSTPPSSYNRITGDAAYAIACSVQKAITDGTITELTPHPAPSSTYLAYGYYNTGQYYYLMRVLPNCNTYTGLANGKDLPQPTIVIYKLK
jgi:hypothetical protein